MTEITLESLRVVLLNNKEKDVWLLQKVYETKMLAILDVMLKKETWSLDEFLMLVIGMQFWPILMNKCREKKRKLVKNVEYAIKQMHHLYDKKIKTIRGSSFKEEINKTFSPIRWLELSQRLKIEIDSKIHRRVLLAYFKLDWRIAENRIDRGITFNENQAAEFLTKRLGISVSPKNVLEMCVKSEGYSFGAYVDYKKYCDFHKNDISIMSPTVIQDAIEAGIVDADYLYSYEGLIRLIKVNKQDVFDQFISSQSIKHIRDGGVIEIGHDIPLLCLQRSLADLILGRSQVLAVKRKIELRKIASSDLLYREEELNKYVEVCQKPNTVNEDEQLLGRPAIKKIYFEVSKHQWDKLFSNEQENGLRLAKVAGENSRQDRYMQSKLHRWLIENAYYTPKELTTLINDTKNIRERKSIADIVTD